MSHEPNVNISESIWPSHQIRQEIKWCEARIESLQPKFQRRPSTQREINDLLRQIEDKRKVLRYRGDAS